MTGVDSRETLEEISKRCGLSEDIIKRVQKAETDFVIECLKQGKRVSIPGRGTFRAELRNKLMIGGSLGKVIKPTFTISSIITNSLSECDGFQDSGSDDELPEGILTMQIPSLV